MITLKKNNDSNNKSVKCKRIRFQLISKIGRHFTLDAPWLQNHIANCPRCQKRIASIGKVNMALSFIKCQPINLNLLMRANTQTINVLKKSLREEPKAQKLKTKNPDLKLSEHVINCFRPTVNLAACLLIMFLMKFGVFSSMDKFQSQGKKAYKQYYASRIGEDLAEDIFPSELS